MRFLTLWHIFFRTKSLNITCVKNITCDYNIICEKGTVGLNTDDKYPDAPVYSNSMHIVEDTGVLQKVLSLGSEYSSATFDQTYFYYKPSKDSPFTKTHFCNLFTQSRKSR